MFLEVYSVTDFASNLFAVCFQFGGCGWGCCDFRLGLELSALWKFTAGRVVLPPSAELWLAVGTGTISKRFVRFHWILSRCGWLLEVGFFTPIWLIHDTVIIWVYWLRECWHSFVHCACASIWTRIGRLMWQGGGHLMPGDQCKQTLGEIKKTSEGVYCLSRKMGKTSLLPKSFVSLVY